MTDIRDQIVANAAKRKRLPALDFNPSHMPPTATGDREEYIATAWYPPDTPQGRLLRRLLRQAATQLVDARRERNEANKALTNAIRAFAEAQADWDEVVKMIEEAVAQQADTE
jgi:hypothetical protein